MIGVIRDGNKVEVIRPKTTPVAIPHYAEKEGRAYIHAMIAYNATPQAAEKNDRYDWETCVRDMLEDGGAEWFLTDGQFDEGYAAVREEGVAFAQALKDRPRMTVEIEVLAAGRRPTPRRGRLSPPRRLDHLRGGGPGADRPAVRPPQGYSSLR